MPATDTAPATHDPRDAVVVVDAADEHDREPTELLTVIEFLWVSTIGVQPVLLLLRQLLH